MTNSEAVTQLIYVRRSLDEYIDENRIIAVNMAISALEENDKLKAEIEQWQSTNLKLVCELTRLECENYQLKSELEQSDSCDGCKHELERNEYYCDGCKRISVDCFELKREVSE